MSDTAAPAAPETAAAQFPVKTFTTPNGGNATRIIVQEPGAKQTKLERVVAKLQAPKPDAAKVDAPADEAKPGEANTDAPAETKTEAKPDEQPKADDAAKRKEEFAAIAKAEKRLRAERDTLEQERKALAAEREKASAETAKARELQAAIASGDKYRVLDMLGVDINEWARHKLGKPAPQQEQKVAPEVAELQKKLQALEEQKAREEAERKAEAAKLQYETTKQRAVAEIDEFLQNSPQYEFTRARKASSVVFATIEEHYAKTNRLLSYDEACAAVESYFEEDAAQYAGVSKFLKKLAPQGDAEKPAPKPSDSGNRASTKPAPVTSAPDRVSPSYLSKEERRKRAVALLSAAPAKR